MERLVHERYYICKNTNTSYVDAGLISPTEREYLIGYIKEELEVQAKAIKEAQNTSPGRGFN